MRRLAAAAAALVLLAGCGKDGDQTAGAGETRTETVERTTRVEVVRSIGEADGFDPTAIYERDGPGVVTVIASGLSRRDERGGGGLGSGFVLNGRGEIATNAHVVTTGEGAALKRAEKVYVRFASGDQVSARIVGVDPFSDVALLRVEPRGLTLRPLKLGSSRDLEVGAPVAAIGSPFGEERSLSVGVISATGRSIQSLTGFDTSGAIQTDAAINSGNSGGPLLNARGEVLGINSQIRTAPGDTTGAGVGFAVPVDIVARSLRQLRETGKVRYAYLGVSTRSLYPQAARHFKVPVERGAWVQEVVRGGPADKAGLDAGEGEQRFQETTWVPGGDVITKVEGRALRQDTDLGEALLAYEPGETVTLEVVRDGDRRTMEVRLGERPLSGPRG